MPTLLIRNIVGFREVGAQEFALAPSLPKRMMRDGGTYTITNLKYRGMVFDVRYTVLKDERLRCELLVRCQRDMVIGIEDAEGHSLFAHPLREGTNEISFEVPNHGLVRVAVG